MLGEQLPQAGRCENADCWGGEECRRVREHGGSGHDEEEGQLEGSQDLTEGILGCGDLNRFVS